MIGFSKDKYFAGVYFCDANISIIIFNSKNLTEPIHQVIYFPLPVGLVVHGEIKDVDEFMKILLEVKARMTIKVLNVGISIQNRYVECQTLSIDKNSSNRKIDLKIKKMLPALMAQASSNEFYYDHKKIKNNIFLFYSKNNNLSIFIDILQEIKFTVKFVDVEQYALVRASLWLYQLNEEIKKDAVLAIYITYQNCSKFLVVHDGYILYLAKIKIDVLNETGNASNFTFSTSNNTYSETQWTHVLDQHIQAYKSKYSHAIHRILLVGSIAKLEKIKQPITEKFKIETSVVDSSALINMVNVGSFREIVIDDISLLIALGLSLLCIR